MLVAVTRKPSLAPGLLARPGGAPTRSAAIEDLPRQSVPAAVQGGDEVLSPRGSI